MLLLRLVLVRDTQPSSGAASSATCSIRRQQRVLLRRLARALLLRQRIKLLATRRHRGSKPVRSISAASHVGWLLLLSQQSAGAAL